MHQGTLFKISILLLLVGCSGGGGGGGGIAFVEIQVANVAVTSVLASDVVMDQPLDRLLLALGNAGYGTPGVVSGLPAELADRTLVIGEIDDPSIREIFTRNGIQVPVLTDDALCIESLTEDADRIVIITGKGPRGVVYGVYEFIRRVTLGLTKIWNDITAQLTPAFPVRFTSAPSVEVTPGIDTPLMKPAEVLRSGYNGVVFYGLTRLCTYDDYDPDLYDPSFYEQYFPGIDLRALVEADRAQVNARIQEAKAHHLDVFLDGDMLVLPSTGFIKYFQEVHHDNDKEVICPAKPRVYEIITATIDEIFKLFPDLDGIQIRSGENYAFKVTVVGNSPIKGSCASCEHMTDSDKLRRVAEEIRACVVDKHRKRLNQRAWGYYDSWHAVPALYQEVVNPIPADPKLTFSLKQTRTDFWRYNELNPSFGLGGHPQWAEFQCQREYEGKGAFPLYMGRYFAEGGPEVVPSGGLKELRAKGVAGIWGWCRGGGWGGPVIQREDWVELNHYALGRLSWNPDLDPYAIAMEGLHLKRGFHEGPLVAGAFESILKLSEEAVLKARYVRAYAEGGYVGPTNGWTPCLNWMRDDVLTDRAKKMADKLYETSQLQDAIAEKEEVLALADQLLAQWDVIRANSSDPFWDGLCNTALYGDSWLRLTSHYFLAAFHYVLWKNSPTSEERLSALHHLARWDEEWTRHTTEIPKLEGCATPFRDDPDKSMVQYCQEMLTELRR
jgi:hypothetical protein